MAVERHRREAEPGCHSGHRHGLEPAGVGQLDCGLPPNATVTAAEAKNVETLNFVVVGIIAAFAAIMLVNTLVAATALLDGAAALVWMPSGRLRVVWSFATSGDRITAIELIADPDRIRELDLVIP